ncbi:MAG: family 20 glycosylhydrolase [Verrucomicrobia bacterium]|nr:family 20 glycosylhydrolase [Verrucomicrobiota bacterium]
MDLLEQLKMNHLQLYVEHSLAYAGHEDVWRAASPITMEELSALNGYCRAHGVALTANQNCFGHFERWLRHPRYADLAERHTGIMANDSFYVPPNTLCPMDSRCLKLIEDLLAQQLPHCSGTYANIGCDEPWDLGRGRSREICAQRGKAAVFSEHVGHVVQLVKNLGKRAQFWCDPHPNEDDNLPVDLVALVWEYEANRPFASRVQSHVNAGREVWVAPGSSCWNSSTGRTWNRRGNLDNAANESAATGFLGTIWGDGGHRQPWPISQFAIGDMAMAAWSGANQYNSLANGLHIFGDQALGAWLEALGEADKEICRGERPDFNGHPPDGKTIHNSTALWVEMHAHLYEPAGKGDLAAWMEVRQRLQQLQQNMPEKLDQNLRQECALALELAFFAADRAVLRRSGPTIDERKALAVRMAEMIAKHRKQWLHRCRYGGLEDSTQHFLQLAKNW